MDQNEPTRIKIPYPKTKDIHLKISTGASALIIAPGIGNDLVTGKYYDPTDLAPLHIDQEGNAIHIDVGNAFGYMLPSRYIPKLVLSFGRRKPFSLSISTGDTSNNFNFGGLPLSSLAIMFGTGKQIINFSYANPNPMSRMKVAADGGTIQIENIANANSAEIRVGGDFSDFELNFSGILKRNTYVCISTLLSHMEVSVPSTTATKITSVNLPGCCQMDDFVYQDKAYWNRSARSNQDSMLHIHNASTFGSYHWRVAHDNHPNS